MTKNVSCKNHSIPSYSGITINISNPTLNAAPMNTDCPDCCTQHNHTQQPTFTVDKSENPYDEKNMLYPETAIYPSQSSGQIHNNTMTNPAETYANRNQSVPQDSLGQSYPPQYYLNNYNYIQNGEQRKIQNTEPLSQTQTPSVMNENAHVDDFDSTTIKEEDMSASQEIINNLDARVEKQKELEENGTQQKVVALTNEYIMSLENYLNNPNTDIRLMASKEILTRLDEDKTRHDDAALNALLNKMLQDPEKIIRVAALSAFSSQLASGNDYTVKLLTDIQNNPDADKEDALQAADCLLKMSSSTEIRYVPANNQTQTQEQVEQE